MYDVPYIYYNRGYKDDKKNVKNRWLATNIYHWKNNEKSIQMTYEIKNRF